MYSIFTRFTGRRLLKRKYVYVLLCLVSTIWVYGQPYMGEARTRHRFAQTTVGLQSRWNEASIMNGTEELALGAQLNAVIGGTHFWGHADFYISIPMIRTQSFGYKSEVETGARIMPWPIKEGILSPFVSAARNPVSFQTEDASEWSASRWPLGLGCLYLHKQLLWDAGIQWKGRREISYKAAPSGAEVVALPGWQFHLGVRWMFDTTLRAETDWLSGRTAFLTDTLAKLGRLNAWTLGIGISSATFLKASPLSNMEWPDFHPLRRANVFPDFSVGYYHHKSDMQLALSWRSIKASQKAFGQEILGRRKALGLELYRFLFDYHGFVPFLGPSMNLEQLQLTGPSLDIREALWRPGLTFGWDIRPNRLQSFYLRTNLRWVPNLQVKSSGDKVFYFDQLEFNFIQLVILPGRIW